MPVLTVSEVTSPQLGFRGTGGRARLLDIDHTVFEGVGTPVSAIVSAAPCVVIEQRGQVEIGERVAADHEERLVVQRRSAALRRCPPSERRRLDGTRCSYPGSTVAEVVLNVVGEVLDGMSISVMLCCLRSSMMCPIT